MFFGKKTRTHQKNNRLIIVDDNTHHDYSLLIGDTEMFVFNSDLECVWNTQKPEKTKKKKDISSMFPRDLFDFYEQLLKKGYVESVSIHVILNDHHLLISCVPITDHAQKNIGVVMNQIPYSNVQKMSIRSSQGSFEMSRFYCIIDATSSVFAIENFHWDCFMRDFMQCATENNMDHYKDIWNMNNVLHQTVDSLIFENDHKMRMLFDKLKLHIIEGSGSSFKFLMYLDSCCKERLCIVSLSKLVDSNTYIHVSIHGFKERYLTHKPSFLMYPAFNSYEKGKSCYHVCGICKRIRCKIEERELPMYRKNITQNKTNSQPMFDTKLNLPVFGKRGKSKQQSENILINKAKNDMEKSYNVWMTAEEWYMHKSTRAADFMNCSRKQVVCDVCLEEIETYFIYTGVSGDTNRLSIEK